MVTESNLASSLMLSRRSLLAGSLASAAMLAVPGRAIAQVDTGRLRAIAQRELDRHKGWIWLRDRVGIVDFTLPSRDPRLFIVDMVGGMIDPFYTTHGRGSDPEHDGWLKSFSNVPESNASSRGAYATGSYYEGRHGLSMRLKGLESDNVTAEDRAIVVHGAWYANPDVIPTQGKLGRSEGCFALPEDKLAQVIAKLGHGRLLFADRL